MPLDYLPILARRRAPDPPRKLVRVEKPAWHPLSKPLHEMRVALVSSAAIREKRQQPFPRSKDASYRKIRSDTPADCLQVDHRSPFGATARKDPEVIFPARALTAAAKLGIIGSTAPFHFSLYGGIQRYQEIEESLAPALSDQLARERIDLAILIPY